jgi:hypothetical protein
LRQRILTVLAAVIIVGLPFLLNLHDAASSHSLNEDATVVFGVS